MSVNFSWGCRSPNKAWLDEMRRDSPRLDYSELIVNGADHSRAVYPCAPRNVNRAGICLPFPKLHPALSVLGPGWFSSCSNLLGEGLVAAFRHPSSVFRLPVRNSRVLSAAKLQWIKVKRPREVSNATPAWLTRFQPGPDHKKVNLREISSGD